MGREERFSRKAGVGCRAMDDFCYKLYMHMCIYVYLQFICVFEIIPYHIDLIGLVELSQGS